MPRLQGNLQGVAIKSALEKKCGGDDPKGITTDEGGLLRQREKKKRLDRSVKRKPKKGNTMLT